MNRAAILEQASALINGERQEVYGDASVSFGRIATLWAAYRGVPFQPHDVAAMMMLLKISRIAGGARPDDWVDAAGYAALGGELAE